jgi:hypothetical protein
MPFGRLRDDLAEIHAGEQLMHVDSVQEPIDVDLIEQAVEVDPLDDGLDIDLTEHRIEANRPEQAVDGPPRTRSFMSPGCRTRRQRAEPATSAPPLKEHPSHHA